jgi:hypothetical protein
MSGRSVLLVGVPRSGTTWIAAALSHCDSATMVSEPDNDFHHVHAMDAKATLGRYPVLRPGDEAPRYAQLFRTAFTETDPDADRLGERRRALAKKLVAGDDEAVGGVMAEPDGPWPWRLRAARVVTAPLRPGRPATGPRIVKTVHAPLAAEWLLDQLRPDAAFVVVRHPANVIGSWRDLGWDLTRFPWPNARMWREYGPPEGNPGPGRPDDWVERGAWHFALLAHALVMAAAAHDLRVIDHEDVLADPAGSLAELAEHLGLAWTDEATMWVGARDQPGEGYDIHRVAAKEQGRWRERLTPAELAVVADVVGRFPLLRQRWELALHSS